MRLGLGLGLLAGKPRFNPVFGMTVTETWSSSATDYSGLALATEATCRVVATVGPTTTGVVMEAGAATTGLMLYCHSGALYFRAGDGSLATPDPKVLDCSWSLGAAGSREIIWSAKIDGQIRGSLYIDGVLVSSDVTVGSVAGTLANANPGGTHEVHGVGCANNGGWTTDASGTLTNGTITSCEVYAGQSVF